MVSTWTDLELGKLQNANILWFGPLFYGN